MGLSLSKLQTTPQALCLQHLPSELYQLVQAHQLDDGKRMAYFAGGTRVNIEVYPEHLVTKGYEQVVDSYVKIVVYCPSKEFEFSYRNNEVLTRPSSQYSTNLYQLLRNTAQGYGALTIEWPQNASEGFLLEAAQAVLQGQTENLLPNLLLQLRQNLQTTVAALECLAQPFVMESAELLAFCQQVHLDLMRALLQQGLVSYLDHQCRHSLKALQTTRNHLNQLVDVLTSQFLTWLAFRNNHPSVDFYPVFANDQAWQKNKNRLIMSIIRVTDEKASVDVADFERSIWREFRLFDLETLSQENLAGFLQQLKKRIHEKLFLVTLNVVGFDHEKSEQSIQHFVAFIGDQMQRAQKIYKIVIQKTLSVASQLFKVRGQANLISKHTKNSFNAAVSNMTFSSSNLDDIYFNAPLVVDLIGTSSTPLLMLQLVFNYLNRQDLQRLACVNRRLQDVVKTEFANQAHPEKTKMILNELYSQKKIDEKNTQHDYMRLGSIQFPNSPIKTQLIHAFLLHIVRHYPDMPINQNCYCPKVNEIYMPILSYMMNLIATGDKMAAYLFQRPRFSAIVTPYLQLYAEVETVNTFHRNGIPVSYFWQNGKDPFEFVKQLSTGEAVFESETPSA